MEKTLEQTKSEATTDKRIDVIIPVYRPTRELWILLDRLEEQTLKPQKIWLINTEQRYFDTFIIGTDFWQRYRNVEVRHISEREFDHGGTRKRIVAETDNDIFVMMTDDAIPADRHLLEHLIRPILAGEAKMSYARQLARKDGGTIEKLTRTFNYPDCSQKKSLKDIETMGIKAFFASDVCAAYDRAFYEKIGGFVRHTIFNEDMIFARKLLEEGETIAYMADACVYHSHNYSGLQQLRRNFDLGVSHAMFPQVFSNVPAEGEGVRLVKETAAQLVKMGKPQLVVKLIWQSGCKYIGYRLGRRYKSLPPKLVKKISMNRRYWDEISGSEAKED